ncbi:hypothetical protein [Leptobacterium sp. I13]|uniref:hypothetical protein n=1 Tax=Leptobacterium meishanense TaxID=3128904 RepID=UPI0030EE206E
MKKLITIVLLLAIIFSCKEKINTTKNVVAVSLIDSAYVASKTAYFTINNNQIQGEGLNTIKSLINESQFVTLGEIHNAKQVSKFTTAIMPFLYDANYKYFALEIGPNSADKLTELSTPYQSTVKNLYDFNTKYTKSEFKSNNNSSSDPIVFFAGVEDAEFLKEARKYNMELWGLDQEFYYSIMFFTDELLKEAKNKPNYNEIKLLKTLADKSIYKWLLARAKGELAEEDNDALSKIRDDDNVKAFFNSFDEQDTRAQKIINDLKSSWDIYISWRSSHVDRVSYIRNNFLNNYKDRLKKNEELPKVFIKIGSAHASKTISNTAYDIGHLTEELAKKNGTISNSLNTWTPTFKTSSGKIINVFDRTYYKRLALFTQFSKENKWAIIDLKSIRKDIENNIILLPNTGDFHRLKWLIESYDYQLILPKAEIVTPNREQD